MRGGGFFWVEEERRFGKGVTGDGDVCTEGGGTAARQSWCCLEAFCCQTPDSLADHVIFVGVLCLRQRGLTFAKGRNEKKQNNQIAWRRVGVCTSRFFEKPSWFPLQRPPQPPETVDSVSEGGAFFALADVQSTATKSTANRTSDPGRLGARCNNGVPFKENTGWSFARRQHSVQQTQEQSGDPRRRACCQTWALWDQDLTLLKVVSQPPRSTMGLPNQPRPTSVRNFSKTGNMVLGHGRCPQSWRQRWLGPLLTVLMLFVQLAQWAATLVCTALVRPNPPMGGVRGPSLTLLLEGGSTPTLDVVPCAIRNCPLSLRTSATTTNTPGCLRRGGSSGTTQRVQCSSSPSARGRKLGDQLVRPTL